MAKTKRITSAAALAKKIEIATANLLTAKDEGTAAATARDRDRKKLLAENKRLSKKRALLGRKKIAASKRLKKAPTAAGRKEVNAIVKELAAVKKASEKARAAAAANTEELKAAKMALKQASTYLASIARIERALNKPKRKRAVKKTA